MRSTLNGKRDSAAPPSLSPEPPPFRPHPLVRSGHAQTLAAYYLPGLKWNFAARTHPIHLPDGDQLVLHEDEPQGPPAQRAALLIHGLSGCHQSAYMQRVAAKLSQRGVRVFRLDLRGCGAGAGLARLPYHAGRHADAAAAIQKIAELWPGLPVTLVGFSLGGAIGLNLAGRCGDDRPGGFDSAVAVSPPVDLADACRRLSMRGNRFYDRHFVRHLMQQVQARAARFGDCPAILDACRPRGVYEFDGRYTAPESGFGRAERYYAECSPVNVLGQIDVPTLVIASRDDPFIPSGPLESARVSRSVSLLLTDRGGHLGFFARRTTDPDRRWVDWRVVEFVLRQGWPSAAARQATSKR